MRYMTEREGVAYFMRRLYRQGLTSCSGGNISVRVGGEVLITPSGLDKGELRPEEVVLVSLDGGGCDVGVRPTIEVALHLEIYRRRADVLAVVHAHPVFSTAFSCMGERVEVALTPETIMTVGEISYAPFFPAGTVELAAATVEALGGGNVVLMRNHGVVAMGPTLLKAFDRLEVTEISAKMTWIARTMGRSACLGLSEVRAVVDLL